MAAAALLYVAALQVHRLDDHDSWWHLASGRLIAATGTIPRTDPFSYTAPGAPWVNRQWLFDVGAYGLWRAGGAAGLGLAAGMLFLAAFTAAYALARRRLPPWAAGVLVFLAASAAVERFAVRPEAVTFLFLAAYLVLLDGPLSPGRLAALVACQVLWANCHALSVLGLVVLGAELAGAAAARWVPLPVGWQLASARPPRELAALGVATAAAALAEAATPFGLAGALFPLRLLGVIRGGEVTSATVVEHRPTELGALAPPAALGFAALLALALVAAAASWRRWRLAHVLTATAFAALAWMARRNVGLVGLGVLPLVAAGLGPHAAALDGTLVRGLARRPLLRALLAGALVVLLAWPTAGVVSGRYYLAARLTRTFGLGVSPLFFPSGAVDFLDARAPDARLFNADTLGGYLLWRSFPRRRVFIDGRLQVYPPDIFRTYLETLENPGAFPPLAARWDIEAALLYHPAPGQLELATAIARLPGWHVAYVDAGTVVLLHGAAAGPTAGVADPIGTGDAPGILGRLLRRVQTPAEEALGHYQRARAVLNLLGREGAAPARADLEATLGLWPDFKDATLGLGYALLLAGDREGARAVWQRLLAADPDFAPARAALAAAGRS